MYMAEGREVIMNHNTGMKLEGKVVIVTGAGTGIGRAIALLFAKEGAKVVCASLHESSCQKTANDIIADGGNSIAVPTQVADAGAVRSLVNKTIETYGKVNILVNNAGIVNCFCKVADVTEEQFDEMFDVNVKGQFLAAKECIPHMIENGGGIIISTSSASAMVAQYSTGVYNATKAAVLFLTKNIAVDYAKYNIRANCICPALVDDTVINKDVFAEAEANPESWKETLAKYPMGRIATPEEVAKGALFLATEDSSFITGTTLTIDGGFTCL